MSETNPRYPHWCKIIRKITLDPMVDEDDSFPLDEKGESTLDSQESDFDPMGSDDDEQEDTNEQQSKETVPEETETEEDSDEGCKTVLIYEGECRSYHINTTSDRTQVIASQRGLALPLNQDGWDKLGVVPQEGDEIVVFHGSTHTEYGRVIDKNIATADFAGTHLTWRYGRN